MLSYLYAFNHIFARRKSSQNQIKTFMIRLAIIFTLIVSAFTLSSQDTAVRKTSSIPSAEIRTLDGRIINTRDLLQDSIPVVLSFWATWCKPCIKELSAINDEMDDWKKEINFRVVAISIDDARTTHAVRNLVNARKWAFEVYLDPNGDFKKLMNVAQPPHTFILSKGEIVYQHTSYNEGDEDEIFEKLKQHQ